MKNCFIISIFFSNIFLLNAQRIPEFQYTLFVEDSRGNKDSVVLGYDRNAARLTLDSSFGERNIASQPFDSVLEMRVADAQNRFSITFHTKKSITFFEGDCSEIAVSSINTLLLRAKYYPVKFSWRKELFAHPCRSKSLLVSSENYFAGDPRLINHTDSIFGTAYLYKISEKTESFSKRTPSGDPNQYFHYAFKAPIIGGTNDTIWTYSHIFRSGLTNRSKEISVGYLSVYPNPTINHVTIDFKDASRGHIFVSDMSGKLVKSNEIELSEQAHLDLSDLNPGVYFVRFQNDDGKTFVSKVIKF